MENFQSNKKKAIFFIILGAVLLVAIIYFVFFYKFNKDNVNEEKKIEEKVEVKKEDIVTNIKKEEPIKNNLPQDKIKQPTDITKIASSFAERFGSFSNQANLENIVDAQIFMTDKMKEWSKGYIKDQRSKNDSYKDYYGVTTKTVTSEIKKLDKEKGIGEVYLNTQRTETKEGKESKYYQGITIKLLKVSDLWLVDGAIWDTN